MENKDNFEDLKPTVSVSGEGESEILVSKVIYKDGNGNVFIHDSPISISTGKVDKGSRMEGAAKFSISTDGKNTKNIQEFGTGRVQYPEQKFSYKLQVSCSKPKSTENWSALLELDLQRSGGYQYFDLKLFRKGKERDHDNDPHITFYPDGSGKYIRYDNTKNIEIETTKDVREDNGLILPSETLIKSNSFLVKIIYSFNDNTLSAQEVILEDIND